MVQNLGDANTPVLNLEELRSWNFSEIQFHRLMQDIQRYFDSVWLYSTNSMGMAKTGVQGLGSPITHILDSQLLRWDMRQASMFGNIVRENNMWDNNNKNVKHEENGVSAGVAEGSKCEGDIWGCSAGEGLSQERERRSYTRQANATALFIQVRLKRRSKRRLKQLGDFTHKSSSNDNGEAQSVIN